MIPMLELLSKPTTTFSEASARVQELQAQDDETIHRVSATRLWSHGKQTARAVLYLHGYTDSVQQFSGLGDMLFAQGFNVFAPRLPHHGHIDRMHHAHGELTIEEMLVWTNKVTDIARGFGEALTVMGLSLGGVLATWVAEQRADVERVLIVAPAYGTSAIPSRFTHAAAHLVKRLPNFFMWWDPRVREHAGFEYTYPRFSTHTLAHAFLLSNELLAQARRQPPASRAVWMITNANDFAVSNKLCEQFVAAWRAHNPNQIFTYEYPRELGIPHDIMDSADPLVKPEVVYPPLMKIVENKASTL